VVAQADSAPGKEWVARIIMYKLVERQEVRIRAQQAVGARKGAFPAAHVRAGKRKRGDARRAA